MLHQDLDQLAVQGVGQDQRLRHWQIGMCFLEGLDVHECPRPQAIDLRNQIHAHTLLFSLHTAIGSGPHTEIEG